MIAHCALNCKEFMKLFITKYLECIRIILYLCCFFFLCFLYFELLFSWGLRSLLCWLASSFAFWFFLCRLLLFFLWYFRFFSPLLDKHAITKSNKAVLGIFEFKLHTKTLFFWILWLGDKVGNIFIKARNRRLVLN